MTTNCKEYMRAYRAKNKERIALKVKEYYESNKDEIKAYRKQHWQSRSDETKTLKAEYNKRWKSSNKGKVNASTAKRRAARLERTPDWLTKEHLQSIESMYAFAKKLEDLCGIKYHVDHIVPLQGKSVSGLHVPWNLQILASTLNESKGNSHDDI